MINAMLDFYDDPTGSVLKEKIPSVADLPNFIKTAERLTDGEMCKLPDDVFALVMFDGGTKLRKYACVDKGNTALSVIYFMENKDALPEEAQKTAAVNLCRACNWYSMLPPDELMLAAGMEKEAIKKLLRKGAYHVGKGAGKLSEKVREVLQKGAYHAGKGAGSVARMVKGSSSGLSEHGVEKQALVGGLITAATMAQGMGEAHKKQQMRKQMLAGGVPGSQVMKAGELTGSSPMPHGQEPEKTARKLPLTRKMRQEIFEKARKKFPWEGLRSKRPRVPPAPKVKTAALEPYVDVTGKQPPPKIERVTGTRFALVKEGEAKYPIDTAEQVQRAFSYFDRYMERFTPAERHQYCVKVAARAGELGLRVPELVEKYGSMTLAPDAHVAIYTRQRLFREGTSEHGLLEEMKTKCAAIKPEVLAVALENFDRETDLDQMWDNGIPDPYFSVFGKVAEAQYSFVHGNDTINEERLKRCARECKDQIKDLFGDDMAEEFAKDPVQIFDSLPLDSKRIIMRVGQQVEE
jgi:hypothetical protein